MGEAFYFRCKCHQDRTGPHQWSQRCVGGSFDVISLQFGSATATAILHGLVLEICLGNSEKLQKFALKKYRNLRYNIHNYSRWIPIKSCTTSESICTARHIPMVSSGLRIHTRVRIVYASSSASCLASISVSMLKSFLTNLEWASSGTSLRPKRENSYIRRYCRSTPNCVDRGDRERE
jgi:hypothetical protein